jgi:DNA-binding transcriptional LysR family regulator
MASPSLRQLHTFLEVIQSGSISAAARRMNVTQPAASQQLRTLEKRLGGRLFERAGGDG